MVKKRQLTPEERRLWKLITRQTKPLEKQVVEENSLLPCGEGLGTKPKKLAPTPQHTCCASPRKGEGGREMGDYSGIDKNTAENFRKGKAAIDAMLDLHGMTQSNAHNALVAFIEKQVKLESRRLLVITGKGSGILRASLPRWLTAPNLNKYILAFDVAKAKHGGDGAYYVLLKRKRK